MIISAINWIIVLIIILVIILTLTKMSEIEIEFSEFFTLLKVVQKVCFLFYFTFFISG